MYVDSTKFLLLQLCNIIFNSLFENFKYVYMCLEACGLFQICIWMLAQWVSTMFSHQAKTSGPRHNTECCWEHMACTFSSLSECWWFAWQFLVLLCQPLMGHMWSFPETPFYSQIFSPKILLELMLLGFLIWEYQLLLQTLGSFVIQNWWGRGKRAHTREQNKRGALTVSPNSGEGMIKKGATWLKTSSLSKCHIV